MRPTDITAVTGRGRVRRRGRAARPSDDGVRAPLASPALDETQVRAACHDLRQTITAGLLLSDSSATEDLEPRARDRLDLLRQQLEQAVELLATIDGAPQAQPRADTEEADLAGLAAACAPTLPVTVRGRDHRVAADPALLRRAVTNLVDNALRAAGEGGEVRVLVGGSRGWVWVEVHDDGPGFGDITHGSGIGLDVVRSAVWNGGGRLHIDTGPGAGTSVRLTFPAVRRRRDGAAAG
jgi:signal transduction histidine kinase